MKNIQYMLLEKPLQECFASFANDLRSCLRKSYKNIAVGCTVGVRYGNASAVLSITPHGDPEEESFDISYYATINEEKKEIEILLQFIGVDLNVIKTYFQGKKSYSSFDNLSEQLIKLFNQFKLEFVKDITSELLMKRPPFYRKH